MPYITDKAKHRFDLRDTRMVGPCLCCRQYVDVVHTAPPIAEGFLLLAAEYDKLWDEWVAAGKPTVNNHAFTRGTEIFQLLTRGRY